METWWVTRFFETYVSVALSALVVGDRTSLSTLSLQVRSRHREAARDGDAAVVAALVLELGRGGSAVKPPGTVSLSAPISLLNTTLPLTLLSRDARLRFLGFERRTLLVRRFPYASEQCTVLQDRAAAERSRRRWRRRRRRSISSYVVVCLSTAAVCGGGSAPCAERSVVRVDAQVTLPGRPCLTSRTHHLARECSRYPASRRRRASRAPSPTYRARASARRWLRSAPSP